METAWFSRLRSRPFSNKLPSWLWINCTTLSRAMRTSLTPGLAGLDTRIEVTGRAGGVIKITITETDAGGDPTADAGEVAVVVVVAVAVVVVAEVDVGGIDSIIGTLVLVPSSVLEAAAVSTVVVNVAATAVVAVAGGEAMVDHRLAEAGVETGTEVKGGVGSQGSKSSC